MRIPCLLLILLLVSVTTAWKAEWIKLNPLQRITPRRSGLVSVVGPRQQPPLIFGGYAEEGTAANNYKRYTVNDLWQWQNDKNTWSRIETTGDIPVPRLVGAAAVLPPDYDKAYLMGGWNADALAASDMFLDTVHALDLATHTWKLLPVRVPDGPVSRHVAVPLPDQTTILVHTHRCTNFVYLWDGTRFTKQPTTGAAPSPRGLHAACWVKKHGVVLFGGAAQDGTMSRQVFCLDTQTWTWNEIRVTTAAAPTSRAGPCLVAVDDAHVMLYGGAQAMPGGGLKPHGDVWLLDLDNKAWQCLLDTEDGTAPPPRNGAALLPMPSSTNTTSNVTQFMLVGGWAPFRETWDDCHVLQVSNDDC